MRLAGIALLLVILASAPAFAQDACLTEDMVARWRTPDHPLNVAEYRLYQRHGELLLETVYEDGSGEGNFDEMTKSGDTLRYTDDDGDYFKLPGGAIELWDGEGKWIEASPAPVCWKF